MGKNTHALMTGLFLLVLVIATTAVIYWIGNFQEKRNVYVVSTWASVSGLNPESTVFYRGIAVGKVIEIKFDPENTGDILIPIEVDKKITLTRGVYATLQLKGVTGLTQIDLQDSGGINQVLPPGYNPLDRIPLMPSLTDKLMSSGEDLLKKAEHVMGRLNLLLNDSNTQNVGNILNNLSTLTAKLNELQHSVDTALAEVPALSTDARKTLKNIDALTRELQGLTKDAKALSNRASDLADSGKAAGDKLVDTTLPKMNGLLTELQATASEVKRVADMLENNPQALLLGPVEEEPGPGEPGFKADK